MEKKVIDPQSRDYNFSDIEPDERFEAIKKEMLLVFSMYTIHAIVLIINLFMNAPNPENYTYVFGFPFWIFFEIVEFIAFIAIAIFVVNHVFVEVNMDPIGGIISKKNTPK